MGIIDEDFIELKEAAQVLHIAPRTLYTYRRKGIVPCYKLQKKLFFKKSELREVIEGSRVGTKQELEAFARSYARARENEKKRKLMRKEMRLLEEKRARLAS